MMIDQILVSKGLVNGQGPFAVDADSVEIVRYPKIIVGGYQIPLRHSRPSKGDYDPNGYSDHFPVAVRVERAG